MRNARSLRMLAITLVAVVACLIPASVAGAAGLYPDTPTLVIDQPVVPPCTTLMLTGTGFLPNTLVTITANGKVVGTVTTDANGGFTFPYPVPCDAVAGQIVFHATDGTNDLEVDAQVVVQTSTTTGTLPKTGSSDTTLRLVQGSVLLITMGGLLVLATRRRTRRDQVG